MRRCILLPIEDSVDNGIAFKVFEEVERYLKTSEWCYYRSNSEILNILANYKKNLKSVLNDKNVLKVVSEKTKTGSLLFVDIQNRVRGVDLILKVYGSNGEDVYFKEETSLENNDPIVIAQTINNWLDSYEKSIPYDGRVIGVLGNQFTTDIGRDSGVFSESKIYIVRPKRKKRHPLLKEVVDWETERIAKGKIIHSNKTQSQGRILNYETKKRLRVEDWVIFEKRTKKNFVEEKRFDDDKKYSFGKIGSLAIWLNYGKGSSTSFITQSNKIGGTIWGIELDSQVWATRNYWAGLKIARRSGTLKGEEGVDTAYENSGTISRIDFKVGYKYLPMGFFYGPQVDAYLGYSNLNYSLDTSATNGFTEVSFKGLLLGLEGSLPVQNMFRVFLDFNFVFNPEYTEASTVYGESDSESSYSILAGAKYQYNPGMTLDFGYGVESAKAKFLGPARSISVKSSTVKIGSTFTF